MPNVFHVWSYILPLKISNFTNNSFVGSLINFNFKSYFVKSYDKSY